MSSMTKLAALTCRKPYAVLSSIVVVSILVAILSPHQNARVSQYFHDALSTAQGSTDQAKQHRLVPSWNRPPAQHVPEATPLFIGFTRNWELLRQCVVSYIVAGWPPSDIYVVENTGTMTSNALDALRPENPFYLDYDYLTRTLGINVLTTPTLLSFSQLQNFYLYTSITRHWPHYFWSHMDMAVVSEENFEPYISFYSRAVNALRDTKTDEKWGHRHFAYDTLSLANAAAYSAVGGFDAFIPYYMSDCDFYFRLGQAGFSFGDVTIGGIFDVAELVSDPRIFEREGAAAAEETVCTKEDRDAALVSAMDDSSIDFDRSPRGDCRYHALMRQMRALDTAKQHHEGGRGFWQTVQSGGLGDPFWKNPEGFEKALSMMIEHGRKVYDQKWAEPSCALKKAGRTCANDSTCSAWRVEKKQD